MEKSTIMSRTIMSLWALLGISFACAILSVIFAFLKTNPSLLVIASIYAYYQANQLYYQVKIHDIFHMKGCGVK
jgi:hypothetical protein